MKKRAVLFLLVLIALIAAPAVLAPFYEPAILMYHSVGYPEDHPGPYVTPAVFEHQMEFLKAHHYRVLPLAELVSEIKSGKKIPMETVAITFDDGYLDNFKNAFPVLKKMDFPATIFMITGNIGRENWLSEEDLRILDGSGVTVGSHTVHHAFLPGLPQAEVHNEIYDSKKRLEAVLGHPVTLFSYPAGGTTSKIMGFVRSAGYEGAVTTNYGSERCNPFALHRVKIGDAHGNLFNFWIKVSGFYHLGKKHVSAVNADE